MPRPFVEHYDLIYCDKDYEKDISTVFSLIGHDRPEGMRLLEVGAGTGNHSLRLASRVRELVSVEIDPDFSAMAAKKFARAGRGNLRLETRALASIDRPPFDSVCALFHVLNYVLPSEMPDFAGNLARLVRPGGRFVADSWNGTVVLNDPPRPEVREKSQGEIKIRQAITPSMRADRREVVLHYDIEIRGLGVETRFQEELKLYLWTGAELTEIFDRAGFRDLVFYDYARFPERATSESWRLWMAGTRAK
jgi:SAM-dependent methyltransferase